METPKITFVCPSYNRVEWLAECVQSLRAQTVKEIEIIIVDDGSTDGTDDLLDWFLSHDDRIRVIKNPVNVGAGESRTIGHKAAKAPIVGVCDSDDVYPVERAQMILDWFEKHPESELVNWPYVRVGYFNEVLENFEGAAFDDKRFKEDGMVNYFCNPSVAVKRDAVLAVPYRKEEQGKTDDYGFVSDWIKSGRKIDFCPDDPIVMHRVLPNSIMVQMRGWKPEWSQKR
jgi:glycosyltransferase involved in cell wall biosynthesis